MSYVFRNLRVSVELPKIYLDSPVDATHGSTGFNITGAVPFSNELRVVLTELTLDNYPRFSLNMIPPNFSMVVRTNLARVWVSLRAYYESSNPLQPISSLANMVFAKDGATLLKRIRTKALLKFWRTSFLEDPEWINDPNIIEYDINEVGDIFYYKYCFPYEEEVTDYEYAFLELKQKKKALDKFRFILSNILDEWNFRIEFDSEEFLNRFSTSSCLKDNGETTPIYLERLTQNNHFRFGKRSIGKRCVIDVHPEGVRDTIINKLPDLNTIQAIEYLTDTLINKNEKNLVLGRDLNSFIERYKNTFSDHRLFYARDITKEGITKPRNLLKIMLEELSARCTHFSKVCTTDFYDGEWLSKDGVNPIKTTRGHGLGMANALTTLMQITIFAMSQAKFEKNIFKQIELTGVFHNDDCLFFINGDESDLNVFAECDDEVLVSLGLIRKKSKSFASKVGGVFCEEYLPYGLSLKESIKRREGLLPLTAVNITHAKSMFTVINLEYMNYYFGEIVNFWGYEFYQDEANQPREIGGWFPYKIRRLNTVLLDIRDKYIPDYARGYIACQASTIVKRIYKKSKDTINNYLHLDLKLDEHILSKLNIMTRGQLCSKFYVPTYDRDSDQLWKDLYSKRQKLFKTAPLLSYYSFCVKVITDGDGTYAIPEEMIERYVFLDNYENLETNYYESRFPISCALRKIRNQTEEGKPSSLWPLLKEQGDEFLEMSIIRKNLMSLVLENFYLPYEQYNKGCFLPKNDSDLEDLYDCYPRPLDICYFYSMKNLQAPILKKEFRPDLSLRKTFYGRNLNLKEFYSLSNCPYQVIKYVVDNNIENIDVFIKELNKLLSEQTEKIIYPSEEWDDDCPPIPPPDEREYININGVRLPKDPTDVEVQMLLESEDFIKVKGNYALYLRDDTRLRGVYQRLAGILMLRGSGEELLPTLRSEEEIFIESYQESFPNIIRRWFQGRNIYGDEDVEPADTGGGDIEIGSDSDIDFAGDFDLEW